jgi:two-component system sensor histidine kinase VicK
VVPHNCIKWISLHAYLIVKDKKKYAIAGFIEDITIQKENEENSSKFSIKKNSVLEILAHDLTGPIGVMQNIASLIKEQAKDNVLINEYTMLIEHICKRNIAMIRDLIQTEYLASSEIEITLERIDLVYKTNLIMHEYRRSEKKLAKTFRLTSSSDKIFAEVDEIKYAQVINNLIGNAIKFTPDGGSISVDIKEQQDSILITVKDNGIGIPQQLQPFLFDRFTKARRPGLKGEECTGLGMSITKKMVELLKGKIGFESKEHQGTTFFIEIPQTPFKQPE